MLSMQPGTPEPSLPNERAVPAPPRRVVAIGGGTGLPAVLRGLNEAAEAIPGLVRDQWLTAVVTVMDDGGSSGRLRQTLGVLPPGDVRNCLAAMARRPTALAGLLNDRLQIGDSVGHPLGNLLLTAMTEVEGDLLRAIDSLRPLIGVSGRVLPVTLENVHLRAAFDDGSQIRGETAIAARRGRIRRLMLDRPVRPVPEAIEALVNAELIVVGPGSLYTSILPNLLVDGVAATLSAVRATRVLVANLMTEPGETDGYSLIDHLSAIRDHTGHDLFDYVLVNCSPLDEAALRRYARDGSLPVRQPGRLPWTSSARIATAELATLTEEGEIRHSPAALGAALLALGEPGRPR